MDESNIVKLSKSHKREILNLFSRAFSRGHPLVPSLTTKPNATKKVMKAFLDFFGNDKASYIYGIKKKDKIVFASVSIDSMYKISFWPVIRFIFALSIAVGYHSAKELEIIHKEEPKYDSRYLELVILGTLPEWQRKGLGRSMLQFLRKIALISNFKGIILVADKDTPAFNLYVKEGLLVDKELKIGERHCCWMRLQL